MKRFSIGIFVIVTMGGFSEQPLNAEIDQDSVKSLQLNFENNYDENFKCKGYWIGIDDDFAISVEQDEQLAFKISLFYTQPVTSFSGSEYSNPLSNNLSTIFDDEPADGLIGDFTVKTSFANLASVNMACGKIYAVDNGYTLKRVNQNQFQTHIQSYRLN